MLIRWNLFSLLTLPSGGSKRAQNGPWPLLGPKICFFKATPTTPHFELRHSWRTYIKFTFLFSWNEIYSLNFITQEATAAIMIPHISWPSISRSNFVSFKNFWKFGICSIALEISSSEGRTACCLGKPTHSRVFNMPVGAWSAVAA